MTNLDIKIENFDLSVGDKNLLKNTNLNINYGRKYGLIGPNGMGKTSLLNAISKKELDIKNNKLEIFLVEQEITSSNTSVLDTILSSDLELNHLKTQQKEMEENGINDLEKYNQLMDRIKEYDIDKKKPEAHKILYGLGFDNNQQLEPTKNFSGGWRMRISLGKALFMKPDLLLLDEPTNHLDLNAVIWLTDYLENWKKSLIVVSHNRDFLDNICSDIIHLHNKQLNYYKGNYNDFGKMSKQIREKELKDWDKLQKKIKENKEKKSRGQLSTKDEKNTKEKKNKKNKHTSNESSSSDKHQKELELTQKPKEYVVKFSFPEASELTPPILEVKDVTFQYNENKKIFDNLDLGITMDDRICIVGANGVGKTTLLNIIMNELQPTNGEVSCNRHLRVGRYNQHFVDKLPIDKSAVEYLLQTFPKQKEHLIRSLLGRYGLSGNTHLIPMKQLSGGQKARIQLLLISLSNPHIILMDEPTNHLDMESIEALIDAINNFNGGIVIISHDIHLIENTDCQLWICENQNITKFDGELEDYKNHIVNNINDMVEQPVSSSSNSNSIFDFIK